MSFPIVFRGYARPQVEARLASLQARIAEVEQARDAALERAARAESELLVRAEESGQALVAVHQAAEQERAAEVHATVTQPVPRGDATTELPAPAVQPDLPSRGRPPRGRTGPLAAAAVALVALVAGVSLLGLRGDDAPQRTAAPIPEASAPAPSVPSPAPSPLGGTTAPQAARVAPPEPAAVPAGWSMHRSPDGLYTIGLPPGWRPQGDGFVSASGLTTMSVRTAVFAQVPGMRELEQYERAFAAAHPGYTRLAARTGPFRGHRAGTWDYVYGSGATKQRGSDLGVAVGQRGYWLRVVSRASAWEFAQPLVVGFRSSFTPLR